MLFQLFCAVFATSSFVLAGVAEEGGEEYYGHQGGETEIYAPQPYDFGYKVMDEYGNSQFRQEKSDGSGSVTGSYGYTDKLGIYRKVVYVADKWGFRANVQTNEPGTASQNPAGVVIESQVLPLHHDVGGGEHSVGAIYEGSNVAEVKQDYPQQEGTVEKDHGDYHDHHHYLQGQHTVKRAGNKQQRRHQ